MRIKDCPECSSGWRYSSDLPDGGHRHREGLVKCPRCHGTARIVEAEDVAKAKHVRRGMSARGGGRAALSPER